MIIGEKIREIKNEKGMTVAAARKKKCSEIRRCRHYLSVAKQMALSEKSATVKGWRRQLQIVRETPLTVIAGFE